MDTSTDVRREAPLIGMFFLVVRANPRGSLRSKPLKILHGLIYTFLENDQHIQTPTTPSTEYG